MIETLNLPEITVAVSTIDDRVLCLTLADLSQVKGVHYLIVHQLYRPQEVERIARHTKTLATRSDIALVKLEESHGVTASRNAAIAEARTPLLLFADDDMSFDIDGWLELRRAFARRPEIDFLCARLRLPEGGWRKNYGSDRSSRVRWYNSFKIGTPELAIRVAPVRDAGLAFDLKFGAGSALPNGDEYIFVNDCIAASLRGQHIPISVGSHPAASSGMSFDRAALQARTAMISRVFRWRAPAIRLLFALRHRRRIASVSLGVGFLLNRLR